MQPQEPNPLFRQDSRIRDLVAGFSRYSLVVDADQASRLHREPETWLIAAIHAATAYHAFDDSIGRMFAKNIPALLHASFAPFRSDNVQGYVLATSKAAVLAIAGSNDRWDWVQNARISLAYNSGDPSRGLHSGFVEHATQACEAAARTKLLAGRSVFLVGHSLGGAASLVASQFLRRFAPIDRITGCLTFGCPRVGNAAEVVHLATSQPTLQLWNVGDPIPHLPVRGCWHGYRHPAGVQRYLSSDGNLYRTRRAVWLDMAVAAIRSIGLIPKPWLIGSPGQAHYMTEYIARLARYLGDPAYA